MDIIVITGISGAGKSVALNVLEDMGYYCVDNLPCRFLSDLPATLEVEQIHRPLAVAIDARTGQSISGLPDTIQQLSKQHRVRVLFLNTNTATLVQRFSETRRRHPLSSSEASAETQSAHSSLTEAIEAERDLLAPLMQLGHQLDTSHLRPNALRAWVRDFVQSQSLTAPSQLTLCFESFGFKHGVPLDADFVFDMRSLPNPHYDPQLKPLTGLDQPVIDFLQAQPEVQAMMDDVRQFMTRWLPSFERDNRAYVTVGIGCTGGQHRSVYIAETLARHFAQLGPVLVRHREQIQRNG